MPACRVHSFSEPEHAHLCRSGPPLPVKILAVAAAFLVFPPLGLVALALTLWSCRHGGGFEGARGFKGHGPFRGRRFWSSGNSVFDEKQREALKKLKEEAEAFAEFRRKQREARDKEDFDRFMADREQDKND
jgi:hypothetical protein